MLTFNRSNKNKCLRIGLLNVRSLNTGQDDLYVTVTNLKLDILALNETWVKDGGEITAPKIPGYTLKLKGRSATVTGGGVGYYVRKGLRVKVMEHPSSALEQLWLELSIAGIHIAIGTAYRPEDVNRGEAIDALTESVTAFSYCNHTFLLTDFNTDLMKPESYDAKRIESFLYQLGLSQLVREPTRITDTSRTLLDLVITDAPNKVKNINVLHNSQISDHALVWLDFDVKKPQPVSKYIIYRPLKQMDREQFKKDLLSLPWLSILDLLTVDSMVYLFNDFITFLFDTHAPVRKIKIKDKPKPWITNMVRFMMTLRDEALAKAHKSKKETDLNYYKDLKNLVVSTIRNEKIAYFKHFVNNNKNYPSLMWRHFKETSPFNVQGNDSIPSEINDPQKINKHFLNVPGNSSINQNLLNYYYNSMFTNSFFTLVPVTESEVGKIISSIKTSAKGHDGISIEMLEHTLSCTLPVITAIVNKSIMTQTYPESFKTALVRPIPKSSNIKDYKDLRPISVLPVLSKVIERVVQKQVLKYLANEKIIPKIQSGFRRGHGTETALLKVTDDLITASDEKQPSILVLLDFSRAFDCINVELLVAKLKFYGFSSNTCKWFQSFLCGRQQYVSTVNNNGDILTSSLSEVNRGTPQGSILSPMLFTLYTADMPNNLKYCQCHLYADDTQIYCNINLADVSLGVSKINEDLNTVFEWAKNNCLVLNPQKSKCIVVGTKNQIQMVLNRNPIIKIDNKTVPFIKESKNLGVIFDGELKFESHILDKVRCAFFKLKVLYGLRDYLAEDVRKILVELLILSPFDYCSAVYGPRITQKIAGSIQRVQNACARFCYKIPKRAHVTPYLNENKLLKMEARRELHFACLVHKVMRNQMPEYLFDKFSFRSDAHYVNTRSKHNNLMFVPGCKLENSRRCFKCKSAKIWNNLPPPLRNNIVSIQSFKKKYKLLLLMIQKDTENIRR